MLVYDARGRGESDGSENNYGWDWDKDVAGALAFLKTRDDVDPRRIGALGLSTGADVLIEVAAQRDDVAALVTDGAAAGSFEDGQRLGAAASSRRRPAWLMFKTIRVLSGDPPGPPLEDMMPRIAAALAADLGRHADRARLQRPLRQGRRGGPVEHWNLPEAHHTDAIHEHRRRVRAARRGVLRHRLGRASRLKAVGEEEELDLEVGADVMAGDEVRHAASGEPLHLGDELVLHGVWNALRLSCTSAPRAISISVFSTSV